MNRIGFLLDVMPLLSPLAAIMWISRVHRSRLNELRSAYENTQVPFPSTIGLSAWAPFRVTPNDPAPLVTEKARINAEIRKQNWVFIPLFFGSFFGLAILSIILHSVLHL